MGFTGVAHLFSLIAVVAYRIIEMLGFKKYLSTCMQNDLPKNNKKSLEVVHSEETRVSKVGRFEQLVKTIYRFDNNELSLKDALDTLQVNWILLYLDKSLSGVRNNTKNLDEHKTYFESCIKELKKLSLTCHPDKGIVENDNRQKLINVTINALRNIHSYVITDDFILKKECYVLYRLYNPLPINMLSKGEDDVSKLVQISPVDGSSVLFELNLLSDMEEGYLMEARNSFLRDSKCMLEKLCSALHELLDHKYFKYDLEKSIKDFNNIYEGYVRKYKKNWVEHLEGLHIRCRKSEVLDLIKDAVAKLLDESQLQYAMLANKHYGINPDENFVLPMLDYLTVINSCHKFACKINHMEAYLPFLVRNTSINSGNSSNGEREVIFIFVNLIKYYIVKNHKKFSEMICETDIDKDSPPNNATHEQLKTYEKEVIMFFLISIIDLLQNRFEEKESSFSRQEEEYVKLKKNIDDIKKNVEDHAQMALELKQKADFVGLVSNTFSKRLFSSDINGALKGKIFEKLDIIIKDVIPLFDENMRSSDTVQRIFDVVIEEISRESGYDWSVPSPSGAIVPKNSSHEEDLIVFFPVEESLALSLLPEKDFMEKIKLVILKSIQ